MLSALRNKREKALLREFRIELVGKLRENGTLFVTSPNLGFFSAVLEDGDWEAVIPYIRKFLEANFGPVKAVRLIHDASELMHGHVSFSEMPPPYMIAELTPERARTA